MINYYSNIFILIIVLFFSWKIYRKKSLLYPGLWFSIVWIISTISYLLCLSVNFYSEYFYYHIKSLNNKIFFTAFSYILVMIICRSKKIVNIYDDFNFIRYNNIFGTCSIVAFLGAFGTWVYKGASFNIVQNRFALIGHNEAVAVGYVEAGQNVIEGILFKLFLLNIPCSLVAGSVLALSLIQHKEKMKKIEIAFLMIPLLSWVFMTIASGGRKGFLEAGMFYGIGFLLTFTRMSQFNKKRFQIYIIVVLVLFLSFMIFSTAVRKARTTERYGAQYVESTFKTKYKFLEPISGVLIYWADPFVGYQMKAEYSMSDEQFLGARTFNGLYGFSVPVVGRITGIDVSIADFLGWERVTNKRWIVSDVPMASTVESIYFNIVDDFGEYGSYVVIFILVLLSHLLYVRHYFKKKIIYNFISIYLFLIFLLFWMNSIFVGYFSGTMPGAIFKVFLFYELYCYLSFKRKLNFTIKIFK